MFLSHFGAFIDDSNIYRFLMMTLKQVRFTLRQRTESYCYVQTQVCVLNAHMMRSFLDLPDNRLAVILKWTGDHHEAGEAQVTLQNITTHLPHLYTDTPVNLTRSNTNRTLHFTRTDMEYLLVAQVSHLLVSQRKNSSSFTRHLSVHFVIVFRTH